MSKLTKNDVGTRFGNFLLLKKIASGGMGEIFLAKQSGPVGFEKILVIKRILQHHLENEQYLDMFRSEARVAAMLTHSNVVQVYAMGEVDEHLYLSMEYVHGRSLKEVVTRANKLGHPVPAAYVADMIAQSCAGLSYSHNLKDAADQPLNLIHRDINPHNLLLSYHGELKIIDFGIAKSSMSVNKTETGTIKGKFIYMSPEQSAAEVLDKRSDIFSLSIVLYEMLAGVNPFQRDNIVLSLEAIQRKDPPPITDYRPDAEAFEPILRKGLAKKVADRYYDASEMREDLLRLIGSKVLPTPPQSLSDWLTGLFADSIDADKQVLLETGSGISSSAAQAVAKLRKDKPSGESKIFASNPELQVDMGNSWSQPSGKAVRPQLDVDIDEETQGFFVPEDEETTGRQLVPDEEYDDEVPTRSVDRDAVGSALAKAIQKEAGDQMSGEAEPTAFARPAVSDEATHFDRPPEGLEIDEETQAFFAGGDASGLGEDGETLRSARPGDDDDDFSETPSSTLKHDSLDVDLSAPMQINRKRLPLWLGVVIGFCAVLLIFFVLRGGSEKQQASGSQDASAVAGFVDAGHAPTDAIDKGTKPLGDGALAVVDGNAEINSDGAPPVPVADASSGLVESPDAKLTDTRQAQASADSGRAQDAGGRKDRQSTAVTHRRRADAGTTRGAKRTHPVSKPKAKDFGELIVNPGPNMRVSYASRGGRGVHTFALKKKSGRINIKGGPDNFVSSFDFRVSRDGVSLFIRSYPWSIVSLNGISKGRTPTKIGSARRFSVELRGPQMQNTVRVIIFYRDPE